MANDFLTTLEIVEALCSGEMTAEQLCSRFSVSVASLNRRIAEARHLGAHIESLKLGRRWHYHCANPGSLQPLLGRWLALERGRSLV